MTRQKNTRRKTAILNEVLSLNAQEFRIRRVMFKQYGILNEVLSLNAQEFPVLLDCVAFTTSSMKS